MRPAPTRPGSPSFVTDIATAQPPTAGSTAATDSARAEADGATARAASPAAVLAALGSADSPLGRLRHQQLGSNMYVLGPDATESGEPIVFGNPHFPWSGAERFYLAHLTIPGTLDIEGFTLDGMPLILLGFNDHLAWSQTISTASRFGFYVLKLNPQDPTSYELDGAFEKMRAVPLTVEVLQPDGSTTTRQRTLYRSRYGPMLEVHYNGATVFPWTSSTAYTLRDPNLENTRLMKQYLGWDRAESLDEFKRQHAAVLGVPWINITASGPGGNAYFGDVSVVPNVPDSLAEACKTPLSAVVSQTKYGLPLLDGSRRECDWQTDADAPAPGIFGPSHLPTLERRDWVANMNDSYWLTNPAQPVTGFAHILGDEGTARSLRTRLGILQIQRRLAGGDGRSGRGFDLARLQDVVLSAQIYSGELARDAVLSELCARNDAPGISAACNALERWDSAANLDSIGLTLWQEFWTGVDRLPSSYWKTPFDLGDPVGTPRDFDAGSSSVAGALVDAVDRLEGAGIALDARLGSVQHSGVNDPSIPIFGAHGVIGAFTVADPDPLTADGYRVTGGNAYVLTVTWEAGRVRAEGFVTYSESTDPANPHFADFTRAYSQKVWQRLPFHDDEVAAAAESMQHLIGARRPEGRRHHWHDLRRER
jgi:acyl-homoserine-lactone acylase